MGKIGDLMPSENLSVTSTGLDPDWKPSNNQKSLMAVAMNCVEKRSIRSMCREAGITYQAFYLWLKEPNFAAAWDALPLKMIRARLPNATAALLSEAEAGEVPAIKLAFQTAGLVGSGGLQVHIGDRVANQVNVTTAHLEVISRASNHAEFVAIQAAVKAAMETAAAKTEVIDVEAVRGAEAGDYAVAASTDDTEV